MNIKFQFCDHVKIYMYIMETLNFREVRQIRKVRKIREVANFYTYTNSTRQ